MFKNKLDATVHQLPCVLTQPAGQVGHHRQRSAEQVGDAGHKALAQLVDHLDAAL